MKLTQIARPIRADQVSGRFTLRHFADCIVVWPTDEDGDESFTLWRGTGDDIELESEIESGNGPDYLAELWAVHMEEWP